MGHKQGSIFLFFTASWVFWNSDFWAWEPGTQPHQPLCPHSLFLSGFMGSLPEPGKQVTMSCRHYVLPVQWMLSSECCSSPHINLLAGPWLPCSVICSSLESSQLQGRGQADPITESTGQGNSFSSQKKGHEKAVWATEQNKQAYTHTNRPRK